MAVFGCSTKRFDTLGLHPTLFTFNKSNKLGPGQYDPHGHSCAYKKNASTWKTKQQSEEFSQFLGFKFPCLLEERKFQLTLNGPGNYDLFNMKNARQSNSIKQDVGFGTEERFTSILRSDQPPPGTYNVRKPRCKFSTKPTFEWDPTERFVNTEPEYLKAPNRYKVPAPSILDKGVSKRGPYDTFTGPRDQTTIKNHFAPPLFTPPDKWYPVPSAMDHLLHHESKKNCGKFMQGKRFQRKVRIIPSKKGFTMFQKDQNYPGPAQYTLRDGIRQMRPNAKPFNCSSVHARPPTNWRIHPGPDRYIVAHARCSWKRAPKKSWMFLTKYPRSMYDSSIWEY